MSDARLQELRRAAEQGDPAARVRWLTERLRAGTLTQEHIELAAWCGDETAREALGGGDWWWLLMKPMPEGAAHLDPPLSLWLRGLSRWGHEALTRAGIEATAACVLAWEVESVDCRECGGCGLLFGRSLTEARRGRRCERCAGGGVEPDGAPPVVGYYRRLVNVARAWVACPCVAHHRDVDEFIVASSDIRWHHGATLGANEQADLVPQAVRACVNFAGEAPVRDAIRSALVAWALT